MKIAIPASNLAAWGGGMDLLKLIVAGLLVRPEHEFFLLIKVPNKVPGLLEKNLRFFLRKWFRHFLPDVPEGFGDFPAAVRLMPFIYRDDFLKYLAPDVVIPSRDGSEDFPSIAYLHDCQHKHYPGFFTPEVIRSTDRHFQKTLSVCKAVIVNSQDTRKDLLEFYESSHCHIFALPFAPVVRDSWLDAEPERLQRYALPPKYFIISNQFWIHKDHATAFKAIARLAADGEDVHLICTGKMEDYRAPDYIEDLKRLIHSSNLGRQITFLGFIDKRDQIEILKNAVAVIQPTLFEGGPGGGSVADALAVGCRAIVSDIPINLELPRSGQVRYFKAGDPLALADEMKKVWAERYERPSDARLLVQKDESLKALSEVLYAAIESVTGGVVMQKSP